MKRRRSQVASRNSPDIPEALRIGRRPLQAMSGVEVCGDVTWATEIEKWTLRLRLRPDLASGATGPGSTEWFIVIDPAYPSGEIRFYPAKNGGLSGTYPHQSFNSEGPRANPWREGKLCLDTPLSRFRRKSYDVEPFAPALRLAWHVRRTLTWLAAASAGTLLQVGEPFELPQFPIRFNSAFAFSESPDELACWTSSTVTHGSVEIRRLRINAPTALGDGDRLVEDVLIATKFFDFDGAELFTPRWGSAFLRRLGVPFRAAWLRLADVPVVKPWAAPSTWGELKTFCTTHDVELYDFLRAATAALRDQPRAMVLVGFPIAKTVGADPMQMHWQATQLPTLASRTGTRNGFRPSERSRWLADRDQFADAREIGWMSSENWAGHEITTRGKLPSELTSKSLLLIGAGAVGCVIAELLVRCGYSGLSIIDADHFAVGNVARHRLYLKHVKMNKAVGVAQYLNEISPQASVRAFQGSFPLWGSRQEDLFNHDIILDCTGSDEVIAAMAAASWPSDKIFGSVSLGLEARRLYSFFAHGSSFPAEAFAKLVTPWLEKDMELNSASDLEWAGTGCWHPLFPALIQDVWMLSSVAVSHILRTVVAPPISELTILERGETPELHLVEHRVT